MLIGGFQKTTLVDYPGRVASIIFTSGCNLRCGYCFNSPLVFSQLPTVSFENIFEQLKKNKKLIDAIVVTGGEPTVWPDLPSCLRQLKQEGFSVKLDSNGSNPEMLDEVIREGLVDYVAMDIKAPWDCYSQVTGTAIGSEKFRLSAQMLKESGLPYEFRTTAGPGITREDITAIAAQLKPADKWYLQSFLPRADVLDKTCKDRHFLSLAELEQLAAELAEGFKTCKARGAYNSGDSAANTGQPVPFKPAKYEITAKWERE